MTVSFYKHRWSPHTDSSAEFSVTSRSQLALYLLLIPSHQLRTHPVATGGELTVRSDSLMSCPGHPFHIKEILKRIIMSFMRTDGLTNGHISDMINM